MSLLRPFLIAALSVVVVGLVVAGLLAPNIVSMPVTVRAGVTDPGPGPDRAAPPVTGAIGVGEPTPMFGAVGVDGEMAVGTISFRLSPTDDPAAAVEWSVDGATYYRVEPPISGTEYEITVTTTIDGDEHVERQVVSITPGQPLEISVLISSAPWLVFFLPVPAY